MNINTDLEKLIEKLPFFLHQHLKNHPYKHKIIEIILDLGRRPEARFFYGSEYLAQKVISWQDLDYITKRINKFNTENRAGIEHTLHRMSSIRNRQFLITGLTCRIGRVILGTISAIRDILESKKSILILGRPGIGKTTILREIGRVLADTMKERVIIVDTSNEIAGDSDIPHSGIGRARRMQVSRSELQHQVMIEAVENHMPQTILIDEIGTEFEVLAARTISEKGVQLIGTTHGNCLENLIKNPSLVNLVGGVQPVILSDEEAKRRKTQKSILERKTSPAFEIIIEINYSNVWTIHENGTESIDSLLRNTYTIEQIRQFISIEKIRLKCQKVSLYDVNTNSSIPKTRCVAFGRTIWSTANHYFKNQTYSQINNKQLIIYPYSIPNNFLKEAFSKIGVNFILTTNLKEASLIMGLQKHLKNNFKLKNLAKVKKVPIYSFHHLNIYQLIKILQLVKSY